MRTNTELMDAFTRAWSSQNLDDIVGLFTEDGVFFASSSYGSRQRARGHEEIRCLTKSMHETDDGAVLEPSDRALFEGGAFCRWRYVLPNGSTELGCDFFQIENGLVALKDAYRKIGSIA